MGIASKIKNLFKKPSPASTPATPSKPSTPSGGTSTAPSKSTPTFTGPGKTVNPFVGGDKGQSTQKNVTPSAETIKKPSSGGGGGGSGGSSGGGSSKVGITVGSSTTVFTTDTGQVITGKLGEALARAKPEKAKSIAPPSVKTYLQKTAQNQALINQKAQRSVSGNVNRSVASILGEAGRDIKRGELYDAGKTVYTGIIRPGVRKAVGATENLYGRTPLAETGRFMQTYSDKSINFIKDNADRLSVWVDNRINNKGGITQKQKEDLQSQLINAYEQNRLIVESNIEKFNQKYQDKELSPEEYKQAQREEKKLNKQIEILDAQGRSTSATVTKLSNTPTDLGTGTYLTKQFLVGAASLVPTLTKTAGAILEKPISGSAEIPLSVVSTSKYFINSNTSNLEKFGSITEVAGQFVAGGLLARAVPGGKVPKKANRRTDTETSIERGDAIYKGKDPQGNPIWDVNSKVITKTINPRTGKIIKVRETQVFSRGISSATKEGATEVALKGFYETEKGIRVFRDANGRIIKITNPRSMGRIEGSATVQPSPVNPEVNIGTVNAKIVETGTKSTKVTKTPYGVDVTFPKRTLKNQPTFDAFSKFISKKISQTQGAIQRGAVGAYGRFENFINKSITNVYENRVRVKGTRQVVKNKELDFGLFRLKTKGIQVRSGYVRKAKSPYVKQRTPVNTNLISGDRVSSFIETKFRGSRKPMRGTSRGTLRAFTPEEPFIDFGGVSGSGSGGSVSQSPSAGLSQSIKVSSSEAATSAINAQLDALGKVLAKKYSKPMKAPGPVKGAKAAAQLAKQRGRVLTTSSPLASLTALSTREREITSSPTGFKMLGGLESGTRIKEDLYTGPSVIDVGVNMPAEDVTQSQTNIQAPGLIQLPDMQTPKMNVPTVVPNLITPRPTTPGLLRPEEFKYIDEKDDKRKKKSGFETGYRAEAYLDATRQTKARWVVVADNVPRITALSAGAKYVDNEISSRFRVRPTKGKVQAIVDTTWEVLQNKFREYASKGKVKVGLKNEWIERQAYRADNPREVATLGRARRTASQFSIYKRR